MELKAILCFIVVFICFLVALWGFCIGPEKGLKITGTAVVLALVALIAI